MRKVVSRAAATSESLTSRLYKAIIENSFEQVKHFISKGADVNAKIYNSKTPLHIAVAEGYVEMVRLEKICEIF